MPNAFQPDPTMRNASSPRSGNWTTSSLMAAMIAVALFGATASASAQTYPSRPVRLVSPFAPGGGTDILGRLIAQRLSELWGVNMYVENRAGAAGNIGGQFVAQADPDGYTLVMAPNSYTMNPHIQKQVPFDVAKDFAPVGMVATSPQMLTVNAELPVKTVGELVALAKAKPGQLNYGSAGFATSPHVGGELFNALAGTNIVHIPYQGSGPAVTALLRNDVQMFFGPFNSVEQHVATGRLRVIAALATTRYPGLADTPTVAESGLPGYDVDLWYALLAPPGTPKPIVDKLNADLKRILEADDVRQGLTTRGFTAAHSSPEELAGTIRQDLAKWKSVAERLNLKAD